MSISRIVNNIASVNANRNLDATQRNLSRSIERLSSGLRINRAGDDAAGLSVANRLRTQVEGLNQAVTNASQGINVIVTAEGALEETTSRLNRIRQLAVQSANTGVNDLNARRALQDEVFQSIDEITRIANTTQFGNNFLLNGDFSVKSDLIDGQEFIGANIDASPVGSTLDNGKSFLNIIKTEQGSSQIIAGDAVGEAQILNTGIINQADVAVSSAFFYTGGTGGFTNGDISGNAAANVLASGFFNGVSLAAGDTLTFSGVLSDGVTQFVGSLSVGRSADTFQGFVSTINLAIDDAERALFGVATAGSVPADFRTTLTVGASLNAGRILLNSVGNNINQADLNISLVRGGNLVSKSDGVTRSGAIGIDTVFTGVGQVGNSVDAITGSTFGAGQFDIAVEDVQAAQQRKIESTVVFRNNNGTVVDRSVSLDITSGDRSLVLNGSFVNGVYTGGTSLTNGSTITLTGTNSDGTTFQANYTFVIDGSGGATNADLVTNDFQFNSVSGLVQELNFRTRDYDAGATGITDGDQARFEDAIFTFTANGTLQLVDDLAQDDSQTQFTLTINNGNAPPNGNFTIQDDAVLTQEGFAESATFRINGGDAVRANAGDVVTLQAAEATLEGVPQPFVTFRVGNGFSAGIDKLETTLDEFVGTLNGGNAVTFNNGDQDVVFIDGNSGGNRGVAKFTTIDFDSIIDVTQRTDGLADAGRTIIISTVNNSLNFQIGAFDGQSFRAAIGDLTSENLGFGEGSGRTVSDIDITTIDGADEAIRIVDEALDQVNKTRSILGAATNRLEATISNLSVSAENLTAAESRIRDADIARETTEFTKNNVLLQAGVSILAQSNFTSQSFLSLIG